MRKIIEARYKKAIRNKVMAKTNQHIPATELYIPLNLLGEFVDLFDSTLGTCNNTLVDLELKDNEKPVNSQTHPVPRVQK